MAEPKEIPLMEKIVSLCKRRGFIYQSSEIYGGINGFWDYGPLGAELKRNVKELWWNTMTRQREDVVGLDATIIMHPGIWKASGHVDTFADMMRECPLTKKRVRADQVEPQSGTVVKYLGALNRSSGLVLRGSSEEYSPTITLRPEQERTILERFVVGERAVSLSEISHTKLGVYGEELLKELGFQGDQKQIANAAGDWVDRTVDMLDEEPFAFLLQQGKPVEAARKAAIQFYTDRGVLEPCLIGESTVRIENSTDFHPESGCALGPARPFNLMYKTHNGPVESDENIAYLRPETAQAIFAQFKNVLDSSRVKVPFGVAQIGKAFRNEVTPRNFTFRSREFEQMELEFFIKPDEAVEAISGSVVPVSQLSTLDPQPNWGWEAWHKYWVEQRVKFYEDIGLPRNTLVEYWQTPDELAHYARATVDILYKFPFSKRDEDGELKGEELEGIAARSDFDLSQHQRFSGKPMGVFDEELRAAWGKLDEAKKKKLWQRYHDARQNYLTKTGVADEQAKKLAETDANGLAKGQYIPHVIEPSAGADRLILALICNAYSEVTKTDDKGKSETTVVLKFHPRVAPIKVGVMPLLKNKPELVKKALEVRDLLRPWMNVFYDDGGSIGKRYARQDEIGTPFCVTIDFDTLGEKPELKDTVTIRHRDDGRQERLAIDELLSWLLARIR